MPAGIPSLGRARYSGQTFVLYAAARTGSNLLISLLNSHPQVLCHYELFNADGVFTGLAEKHIPSKADAWAQDPALRDRDPEAFLDRLYGLGADYPAQGFKLLAGQGRAILGRSLADPRSKSLVLKRRDLLKVFVSGRVARKTGGWTWHDEQRLGVSRDARRIRFNRHAFCLFLLRTGAFYAGVEAALNAAGKDYHVIHYEDLVAAPERTLGGIGAYLGVPAAGFDPSRCWFSRQNPESALELVTNPGETARFLSRTDFTALFHGDRCVRALWLAAAARLSDLWAAVRGP